MAKESKKNKRTSIPLKRRLSVFKRDNYACVICKKSGTSEIEIDHIIPHSCGGTDEISNLQTLCSDCNRGKGNDETLNKTIKNELDSFLNDINPEILKKLNVENQVSVVANQEDYVKISKINHSPFYKITPSTNTLMGFQSGRSFGIYAINDNNGSKVHFFISKLTT